MDLRRSDLEHDVYQALCGRLDGADDAARAVSEFGVAEIELGTPEGHLQAMAVARSLGYKAAPVNATTTLLNARAGSLIGRASICVGHTHDRRTITVVNLQQDAEWVLALGSAGSQIWPLDGLECRAKGGFDQGSEVSLLAPRPGVEAESCDTADLARTAISLCDAEMISATEAMIERTVEYLTTRVQFGRPIGSFQALQHRMADAATKVTAASLAVDYAATMIVSEDHVRGDGWIHGAHAYAAETALAAAMACFQMHGGIAFTSEFWIHRYLRRVTRLAAQGGSPEHHYRQAAPSVATTERLNRFLAL